MNLTKEFPRSPYDMAGGLVMLPRTCDKIHALQAGTLGEYIYPCPLDERLLEFLGLAAEDLAGCVRRLQEQTQIIDWVEQQVPRAAFEKDAFNNIMRHLKPSPEDRTEWFDAAQKALGRDDYDTVFAHLDAEEGRF